MSPAEFSRIYPPSVQAELARMVQILSPVLTPEEALARPDLLGQMDILISGWGGPSLDKQFLDLAPHLKAIFYGAGAIGYMLTEAFLERDITVTTANAVNAVPVAEFSLAHILLGLKRTWQHVYETKKHRSPVLRKLPVPGAYRSTVGLISLSTIGRLVRQRLESCDMQVIAYDPTIDEEEAMELDVEMVSLEELFARADVISLHAPVIPQTIRMIKGSHLASMKEGATFINTARGEIVREDEMIEVLRVRPDLTAILDVTYPEPPVADSPLYDLPNAILTPHIAGSLDGECERMGRWMVDEVRRYLAGKPLLGRSASHDRSVARQNRAATQNVEAA
jgi:phosphoglycerate dehydrogenase-like enzyme